MKNGGITVANTVYEGPWAGLLRNDLNTADIIIFVGYSLFDPEIAKLIKSAEATHEKIFFINSSNRDSDLDYMQKNYGTPKWIERDGFVKILASAQKQAGKKSRQSFVCFDKGEHTVAIDVSVKQSDLSELFLFGNYDKSKAQIDANSNTQKYTIKRDLVSDVVEKLDKGADFISIYSPLGHGKTIFAHSLASTLRAKGEPVFLATRNQPEFIDELHEIVAEYNQPIIIIDDFFRYTKHWDTLAKLGGRKVRIIATARYNIFSTRETDIINKFIDHSPISERLRDLSNDEGKSLVPLITQAGLWGANAALKDWQKLNLIKNTGSDGYQNNFADILVGLMESNDIVNRLKKELSTLKEISQECYEGVLITIYLEFTNNDPDTTLLEEGFGSNLQAFLNDQDIESLLRIFLIPDSHGIRYRSSVFSKYALEHACEPNDVIEVIKKTVETLATTTNLSNDYSRVVRDLMRFNYLKNLCFDGDFSRASNFYDDLSAIPEINHDDLFWNAFGMCERARHNYISARKHFNTSIANATNRGPNYVPYHAQNQLIICILEAGTSMSLPPNEAFKDLLECISLLTLQAEDERSYGSGQAFSWHKELGGFCDQYLSSFNDNQERAIKTKLGRYSNYIRTKVVDWEKRKFASRMVSEVDRILK